LLRTATSCNYFPPEIISWLRPCTNEQMNFYANVAVLNLIDSICVLSNTCACLDRLPRVHSMMMVVV